MPSRLIWYGERVSARMREAARAAIDETMGDAVNVAAELLPGSPGGPLADTVRIQERARPVTGGHVAGLWGSRHFLVWIYEVGSFRHTHGWDIRPMPSRGKRALASATQIYGRRVHHPPISGRHSLRRAADIAYPLLAMRVARHFAGRH